MSRNIRTGNFLPEKREKIVGIREQNHMTKIAILPIDAACRAEYLGSRQLPVNYMSDYSLMGFVVDRYSEALELLSSSGYHLDKLQFGAEILIQTPRNLTEICSLLARNSIQCDLTDIVDSLYQA